MVAPARQLIGFVLGPGGHGVRIRVSFKPHPVRYDEQIAALRQICRKHGVMTEGAIIDIQAWMINYNVTYATVPSTAGHRRRVTPDDVVEFLRELLDKGYRFTRVRRFFRP